MRRRLGPGLCQRLNNLGNALNDCGELDEAVACYRRALEAAPNYAEAHSNLGTVLKDQGRLEEAVACYRRALELKPNFVKAHSDLVYTRNLLPRLQRRAHCGTTGLSTIDYRVTDPYLDEPGQDEPIYSEQWVSAGDVLVLSARGRDSAARCAAGDGGGASNLRLPQQLLQSDARDAFCLEPIVASGSRFALAPARPCR